MSPSNSGTHSARPEIAVEHDACDRAWSVLSEVLDPEVPALSIVDLGIVRDVIPTPTGLEIVLTPTYSGCPATEAIENAALAAIDAAGLGPARVVLRRAPAWSSDWISADGKRKLREYGIAPPAHLSVDPGSAVPMRFVPRNAPSCPRCGSDRTERLSAFGATACKALHRCLACREPFEYFKPI
jgi:ring-1,2-phenylacetyl-CoA epoxidase subunit PaaD